MIDFKALSDHFPADAIHWRVGSTNKDKTKGMALAFLDARDVMDRLDAVCGPAGWACSYSHANGKTVCDLAIKCGDEWVSKADGAGDSDVEAEKGALSDAFKRSAVRWGIGRYLYDLASPWVAIEPMGRSYKIAEGELKKLRALLTRNGAPQDKALQQTMQEQGGPDEGQALDQRAVDIFKVAISLAKTTEALEKWHKENRAELERLNDPTLNAVRVIYTDKLHALKHPAKETTKQTEDA